MTSSAAPAPATSRPWVSDFLLLSALWGASFMFMRLGAVEFGPLPTAFLRVSLAALFLLPIMWQRGEWDALVQHWRPILLIGVINSALPFALYSWAVTQISTGLASILNATVPLFGAFVGWLWLSERIQRLRWLGLLIGFAGVTLLASRAPGGVGVKTENATLAIAVCLLAATSYGVAANFAKRFLTGVPPLAMAAGSQVGASLALAIPALLTWPSVMPSLQAWGAVSAMAVLCTGIAYILFFRIIVNAGPSKAVAVTFLAPVFALLYGRIFLGELVTPWMLGCAAIIVSGTMLATGLVAPKLRTSTRE